MDLFTRLQLYSFLSLWIIQETRDTNSSAGVMLTEWLSEWSPWFFISTNQTGSWIDWSMHDTGIKRILPTQRLYFSGFHPQTSSEDQHRSQLRHVLQWPHITIPPSSLPQWLRSATSDSQTFNESWNAFLSFQFVWKLERHVKMRSPCLIFLLSLDNPGGGH